jgi:RNA polymerase-interacting CarD/CdnL/TRCF family regulator
MEYLGLTIDTREMTVKIPDKKMKELLVLIREVAFSKKVTLCGVLALYL